MQIHALVNQKGGVGKTTSAINLAACLAERGKRVLLIDLDPQANATSGVGVAKTPGTGIYDPLIGTVDLFERIVATKFDNLSVIPSELDLAGAQIELARMDDGMTRLRDLLAPLRSSRAFDIALIDCSPSLGMLTMNVLNATQGLILPIQCEYFALEGLSSMMKLVNQIQDAGTNPDLNIAGILMTMFDTRTRLAQQVVAEVMSHFGETVFQTVIPRNVRLGEAPSHGKPIIHYAPYCSGAIAYRALAKEAASRFWPEEPIHD